MTTEAITSGLVFLFLITVILDAVYHKGRRDGYKAAVQTEPPASEPPAVLEVVETFQSENVLWRFGTGHTVLTGYCPRAAYPAQALEKVQLHLNAARHAAAADELLDEYLATHGPFREMDGQE